MVGTSVQLQATKFVGAKIEAPFEMIPDLIPESRSRLVAHHTEIEFILNPFLQLAITWPNEQPADPDTVITYFGFEVSQVGKRPAELASFDLPGGEYIRFDWVGSLDSEEFEDFYPSIFGWFQLNNRVPSTSRPWIEVYDERHHDWSNRENMLNRLAVFMPVEASRT